MDTLVRDNPTRGEETQKASGFSTRRLVIIAMFSALSAILMLFELSLPIAPSFLKFDISDLPAILGTFMMGPVAGIIIEALKNILKLLFRGSSTAFVGELANFAGAAVFVLTASLVYRFKKGKLGAVLSLCVGTILTTIAFAFIDYFVIFPMYVTLYGMPMDSIIKMGTMVNGRISDLFTMMVYAVAPFNLIKYGLVSLITFFTYKRLKQILFR